MEPERDLLQVAAAQYALGVLPGSVQRRQQHGRKDGDDRDDDQQLDQRETLPTYPEVSFSDGHWVTQGAWGWHRLKRMRGATKLCAVSGCIKLGSGRLAPTVESNAASKDRRATALPCRFSAVLYLAAGSSILSLLILAPRRRESILALVRQ